MSKVLPRNNRNNLWLRYSALPELAALVSGQALSAEPGGGMLYTARF